MKDVLGDSFMETKAQLFWNLSQQKRLSEYVVTIFIYINRMSTTHHETEDPKTGSDKASLYNWIADEVSQTLLEELPIVIRRITDRFVIRFKEHIMTIRIVKEVVRTTQEGELGLGTQLGKRKQGQDSTLPKISKKLDGTTPYIETSKGRCVPGSSVEGADKRGINIQTVCQTWSYVIVVTSLATLRPIAHSQQ